MEWLLLVVALAARQLLLHKQLELLVAVVQAAVSVPAPTEQHLRAE
jgi:hypothetical protein